jgi:predicted DsbA family dithiol-disulfide isomerase
MQVQITGGLEARLARAAEQQGRSPDQVVQAVLSHYFEEEARFMEAMRLRDEALDPSEHFTHEQVVHRLRNFLHA